MKNLILSLIFFLTITFPISSQVTAVVMSQDSGLSSTYWFTTGSNGQVLRENDIKNQWNYDKYITSASYNSNGWFMVMSLGTKWTNQSYKTSSSWPDEYVHNQKEKGYMITSLTASSNKWLVVTTEGTGYTDQQICSAPWSSLESWIKKWWDKDYYITSIACKGSLWTVVMSYGYGVKYTGQSYFGASSTSKLEEKVKAKWNEGYRITALEYDGGEYLCVMSKYYGSSTQMQTYSINDSFKDWVESKEKEGYRITYVGG
ncbi:MAG: hypothetical protein ACI31F_01455 [Muribaculaceae bacterium]